jgi:hypothetical protein
MKLPTEYIIIIIIAPITVATPEDCEILSPRKLGPMPRQTNSFNSNHDAPMCSFIRLCTWKSYATTHFFDTANSEGLK